MIGHIDIVAVGHSVVAVDRNLAVVPVAVAVVAVADIVVDKCDSHQVHFDLELICLVETVVETVMLLQR